MTTAINVKISDGAGSFAPAVTAFSYRRGRGQTADRLSLGFLSPGFRGEATGVLFETSWFSFAGVVDSHQFVFGDGGQMQIIEARGQVGAYLEDNEAFAESVANMALSEVVALHGYPYGVAGLDVPDDRRWPLYTTAKGASEWDCIAGFVQIAYNFPLVLSRENRLVVGPWVAKNTHVFSAKSGHPLYGLDFSFLPKNRISQIRSFTNTGKLTTYNSPERGNTIRRRFHKKPTDFSREPAFSESAMLMESLRQGFTISFFTPGFFPCDIGDEVSLPELSWLALPLRIGTVEHGLTEGVMFTKITAYNMAYGG